MAILDVIFGILGAKVVAGTESKPVAPVDPVPVPQDLWANLNVADRARIAELLPKATRPIDLRPNGRILRPRTGSDIETLIDLLEAEHERGLLWSLAPFAMSGYTIKKPTDTAKDIILFSLVVVNDGAGDLDCYINTPFGEANRVKAGETLSVSYKTAVIQSIFLLPVSGSTPTVRLSGTY